jgi:hypothetical protein
MLLFIAKSCLGVFAWLVVYLFVSVITNKISSRKSARPRWNARRPRHMANPLWALEELRDLRDPLFVADPEFTPFKIEALGSESETSDVSSVDARQFRSPVESPFYRFKREFPIPELVTGLPWRYFRHISPATVPEGEFIPLHLSCLSRKPEVQRPTSV